uniref:Major facilitator superfamily (MFS) profile domain-containing protein n=1 Tax=Anopheles albimanus TaxID=7167 RepID=A0A182FC68_ANOAL
MPSTQGYRKVASEPPIDPVDVVIGGASDSATTATGTDMPGSIGTSKPAMAIQSNPAGKIPATNSQQRLMPTDSDSVSSSQDEGYIEGAQANREEDTVTVTTTMGSTSASAWFTVAVLCFVNLINYMDRFTIAAFKRAPWGHSNTILAWLVPMMHRTPKKRTSNEPLHSSDAIEIYASLDVGLQVYDTRHGTLTV